MSKSIRIITMVIFILGLLFFINKSVYAVEYNKNIREENARRMLEEFNDVDIDNSSSTTKSKLTVPEVKPDEHTNVNSVVERTLAMMRFVGPVLLVFFTLLII